MEQIIAVVNESTMGAGAFKRMVSALTFQIERDFNFCEWVKGEHAPHIQIVRDTIPTGAWPIFVKQSAAGGGLGMFGWHDKDEAGNPFAECNYGLAGKDQITLVLSHEALEMACNPFLDRVYTDPATGNVWLGEVCDPVYKQTYEVQEHVVADFVLPEWLGLESGPGGDQYTHLRTVAQPFTLGAEGYDEYQSASELGVWKQIFGPDASPAMVRHGHGRLPAL